MPARAESTQKVVIEDLDTREFPKLTLNFKILGGLEQDTSLAASQVTVIESDKQIAVDALTSEYVGVHFGLVINPNAPWCSPIPVVTPTMTACWLPCVSWL